MPVVRRALVLTASATSAALLAACSPSPAPSAPGGSDAPAATSITELDYYADEQGSAAWQKILDTCATQTGIKIERQKVPTNQMLPKVLQSASSKTLPNLLF